MHGWKDVHNYVCFHECECLYVCMDGLGVYMKGVMLLMRMSLRVLNGIWHIIDSMNFAIAGDNVSPSDVRSE